MWPKKSRLRDLVHIQSVRWLLVHLITILGLIICQVNKYGPQASDAHVVIAAHNKPTWTDPHPILKPIVQWVSAHHRPTWGLPWTTLTNTGPMIFCKINSTHFWPIYAWCRPKICPSMSSDPYPSAGWLLAHRGPVAFTISKWA